MYYEDKIAKIKVTLNILNKKKKKEYQNASLKINYSFVYVTCIF